MDREPGARGERGDRGARAALRGARRAAQAARGRRKPRGARAERGAAAGARAASRARAAHGGAPVRRAASRGAARELRGRRGRGRARRLHRGHGAALRRGRPGRVPRRRGDDRRALGRRRGEHTRAVPPRGGRPPDREREVPRRSGRRHPAAAAGPDAAQALVAHRLAGSGPPAGIGAPWAGAGKAGSRAPGRRALHGAGAMRHKVRHIHFVGIGGSGMSGIAEVLLNLGYQVSGSDLAENAATRRLAKRGARVSAAHAAANVNGADAVVVSSAVHADNAEVIAARERRIPVVPRALMLVELMRLKQGVAIAGTHGKTTTTSLVASVLAEGGIDLTFVIGGRLNAAGSNARLGSGDFLVAEADESDASFLFLSPVISVVTNIDADHMETYGHDFERLKSAFVDFLNRLPFYGVAVVCGDDANVRDIMPRVPKQIITYGLSPECNFYAENVVAADGQK